MTFTAEIVFLLEFPSAAKFKKTLTTNMLATLEKE